MSLTTCNQKEFLIESKLNGFLFFFLLHLDLEIFIGERGRGDGVKWAFYCEYHPNASVYMYPKGFFDWIKIKWILGAFVVTLGLGNFHMGGEVKWTFLKNYSIFFWLMPVTLCTQKKFWIDSKLNGFFGVLLLHLDLEIFIGEVK